MPQGSYFFIKNHLNGLVLGVSGSKKNSGTKVFPWEKKATAHDNQLWFFHKETETLRCRLNGWCLHIKDGVLQLAAYEKDVTTWQFIENRIQSRQEPKKVLAIIGSNPNPGAKLGLEPYLGGANQHWNMEYTEPPYFYIRSKTSNRVMDVAGDEKAPRTKVVMWPQKGYTAPNQLWYLDRQGHIRTKLNDFALEIINDRIVTMPYDPKSKSQQWHFEDDFIVNSSIPDKVFDIVGAANKDGAELCAWPKHGKTNQRWTKHYV